MTLQEIDEMAIIEPYCFENEQEEQWYKVGLREGADAAIKHLGWHPASELPVIPKKKNWVSVVALVDFGDGELKPRVAIYKDKGWSASTKGDIKWWCYPPKEE